MTLTTAQQSKLYHTFKEYEVKTPQYAKWQLKPENCTITCYTSGKTVFQGKDAEVYASPFGYKQKTAAAAKSVFPQAGSDEVGTGDYFGPIIVAATIITKEDLPLLHECGVRDSKALRDSDILKAGKTLIEHIPHTILIVSNEKYNAVHKTDNINAVKAKLHNQAYINLARKYTLPDFKIIDQFTPEKSYYNYLKNVPEVIGRIHFETKAEDKYPSVGCASVIARYTFLQYMEKMEEKYGMKFQKGAGAAADECAREFAKKYGKEKLCEVAKLHFKNTERI